MKKVLKILPWVLVVALLAVVVVDRVMMTRVIMTKEVKIWQLTEQPMVDFHENWEGFSPMSFGRRWNETWWLSSLYRLSRGDQVIGDSLLQEVGLIHAGREALPDDLVWEIYKGFLRYNPEMARRFAQIIWTNYPQYPPPYCYNRRGGRDEHPKVLWWGQWGVRAGLSADQVCAAIMAYSGTVPPIDYDLYPSLWVNTRIIEGRIKEKGDDIGF